LPVLRHGDAGNGGLLVRGSSMFALHVAWL